MLFSNSQFYNIILVLGFIGILDTLALLMYGVGINFGILFPGVLGMLFVILGIFYNYFGMDLLGIKHPLNRKVLITVGTLWLMSFVIIEGLIISGARSDEDKPVDYIVVLGAALHGDNLSFTLRSRMDTALKYLNSHPKTKVVVSGGRGLGETLTEAEAMRRFLVNNHISDKRILKEEKSTSTIENLRFSKSILAKDPKFNQRIMIVTNDFHLYRGKNLAKRIGLTAYGLPAKTPRSIIFNVYCREYLAIIKSYLFDKG